MLPSTLGWRSCSGATESNLRQDPAYQALPPELTAAREAIPRGDGERNLAYARRLHGLRPELTLAQLALLSGAREGHLKRGPRQKTDKTVR